MVVSRFQVMSILQAARARSLGLPVDSAYSWGLNRAIFYAAAKRGFKGSPASGKVDYRKKEEEGEEKEARGGRGKKKESNEYHLGDEMAFKAEKDGKLYFTMGGEVQTEKDFDHQVKSRFAGDSFRKAWEEALDIIKKYDASTLKSGREFFDQVYKPRRDELAKKWSQMS